MRYLEARYPVLAHWRDGLFYVGSISKVDKDSDSCRVTFEDGSIDVLRTKDVYTEADENEPEITCDVCYKDTSEAPNEIVLCDQCHYGFHQACHTPKIESSALAPGVLWHCRRCVFSAAVKAYGCPKTGPMVDVLRAAKLVPLYELDSLEWDAGHRVNDDDIYCYCGGPGDWFMAMLRCSRCLMWYHESCLQCMDQRLLYGDPFYVFVCTACTKGDEYIERLPVPREDMVHLALFNMNIAAKDKKKYFESSSDIASWIRIHWEVLTYSKGNPLAQRESFTETEVRDILMTSTDRFLCGTEVHKSKYIFALRIRAPPRRTPLLAVLDGAANSGASDKPPFLPSGRVLREPSPEHVIGRKRRRHSALDPDSPPAAHSRVKVPRPKSLAGRAPPGRPASSHGSSSGEARASGAGGPAGKKAGAHVSRKRSLSLPGSGASSGAGTSSGAGAASQPQGQLPPCELNQAAAAVPVIAKRKRGRPPGSARNRCLVAAAISRVPPVPAAGAGGTSGSKTSRVGAALNVRGVMPSRAGRGGGRVLTRKSTGRIPAAAPASRAASSGVFDNDNPPSLNTNQGYTGYTGSRYNVSLWNGDLFSTSKNEEPDLPVLFDVNAANPQVLRPPAAPPRKANINRSQAATGGEAEEPPVRRPRGRPRKRPPTPPEPCVSHADLAANTSRASNEDVKDKDVKTKPEELKHQASREQGAIRDAAAGAHDAKVSTQEVKAATDERNLPVITTVIDFIEGTTDGFGKEKPSEKFMLDSVQSSLGATEVVTNGSAPFHLTAKRFLNGSSDAEYLVEHESRGARQLGFSM